jgi:hypothetical protein
MSATPYIASDARPSRMQARWRSVEQSMLCLETPPHPCKVEFIMSVTTEDAMNRAPTRNQSHKRNRPDGRGVSLFFVILLFDPSGNAKASL